MSGDEREASAELAIMAVIVLLALILWRVW
jgi:hypothetical protein